MPLHYVVCTFTAHAVRALTHASCTHEKSDMRHRKCALRPRCDVVLGKLAAWETKEKCSESSASWWPLLWKRLARTTLPRCSRARRLGCVARGAAINRRRHTKKGRRSTGRELSPTADTHSSSTRLAWSVECSAGFPCLVPLSSLSVVCRHVACVQMPCRSMKPLLPDGGDFDLHFLISTRRAP